MELSQTCLDLLLAADGKALATYGVDTGVNVVPVSTIKVVKGEIVLVNYFFGQTLKNLEINNEVSLACWKGLGGFQIKCTARHERDGELFEEISAWVKEILPDRIVRGVVVLSPTAVFDVSADSTKAGKKVA